MKDFLNSLYIEPFKYADDWWDYVLGTVIWLCSLLVISLVMWFFIWAIDSWYLPTKQDKGVVAEKTYHSAYWQTTYITSGKIMVPVTTFIPESYGITIDINGVQDEVSVSQCHWNDISKDDTFCCIYTKGRILNSIYIKDFCHE